MPGQRPVMRAPTLSERLGGYVQSGWEAIRDHPAVRALELAGATDREGWDRTFTDPAYRNEPMQAGVRGPKPGFDALAALQQMGVRTSSAVPTSVRGAAQGRPASAFGLNASGEAGRGGPSMEALSRAAGERASRRVPTLRGPGGVERPYVGDAVDAVVNPGWEIGYKLPGGGWEKIR